MARKLTLEELEVRLRELERKVAASEQSKQASPAEERLLTIARAAYVALVHHAVGAPPSDEYIRTRTSYYTNLVNKCNTEDEMAKHLEEVIEEMRTYRKSHQ